MKNPFKRPNRKEGCQFDRNTGTFHCESKRVLEDGTEVDLGGISGSVDAECQVVVDEVYENEEGTIDRMDKKFVSKIKAKCKSRPQDY